MGRVDAQIGNPARRLTATPALVQASVIPPGVSGGSTRDPMWSLDLDSGTGTTDVAAFPQAPNSDYFNCVSIDRIQRLASDGSVTPPAGQSHMMRVVHNPDDVWAGTHRAELNCEFAGIATMLGGGSLEGKTIWIGFKYRPASPWDYPDWTVCGQLHGGNNNIFGHTYDDVNTSEIIELEGPAAGENYRSAMVAIDPALDTWQELKVGFAPFSTGSSGRTFVYHDGALIAGSPALDGPNLFTGFEDAPFLKLGVYRGGSATAPITSTVTIYYADVRMAATLGKLG